jgi:hypothetical protein
VLHYRAGHRLWRHVADTAAVQCRDLGTEGLKTFLRNDGTDCNLRPDLWVVCEKYAKKKQDGQYIFTVGWTVTHCN